MFIDWLHVLKLTAINLYSINESVNTSTHTNFPISEVELDSDRWGYEVLQFPV